LKANLLKNLQQAMYCIQIHNKRDWD